MTATAPSGGGPRNEPAAVRLPSGRLHYTTSLGAQYSGDSQHLLGELCPGSVDLFVTSPPFPLLRPKEYGNTDQEAYVTWLLPFAEAAHRALKPGGSLVLDLGSACQRGRPVRSLHQFRVLLALTDRLGFHLAQDFYWHNPSRLRHRPSRAPNARSARRTPSTPCGGCRRPVHEGRHHRC